MGWIPLHFTLKHLAEYPFEQFPKVEAWAERISERPSFKTAVMDWWPQKI
jgi:glutathione S-transferase